MNSVHQKYSLGYIIDYNNIRSDTLPNSYAKNR